MYGFTNEVVVGRANADRRDQGRACNQIRGRRGENGEDPPFAATRTHARSIISPNNRSLASPSATRSMEATAIASVANRNPGRTRRLFEVIRWPGRTRQSAARRVFVLSSPWRDRAAAPHSDEAARRIRRRRLSGPHIMDHSIKLGPDDRQTSCPNHPEQQP